MPRPGGRSTHCAATGQNMKRLMHATDSQPSGRSNLGKATHLSSNARVLSSRCSRLCRRQLLLHRTGTCYLCSTRRHKHTVTITHTHLTGLAGPSALARHARTLLQVCSFITPPAQESRQMLAETCTRGAWAHIRHGQPLECMRQAQGALWTWARLAWADTCRRLSSACSPCSTAICSAISLLEAVSSCSAVRHSVEGLKHAHAAFCLERGATAVRAAARRGLPERGPSQGANQRHRACTNMAGCACDTQLSEGTG